MQSIEALIQKPGFIGKKLQCEGKEYVVKQADNYSYTDPVDGSKATKQVRSMIVLILVISYLRISYNILCIRDCGYCLRMAPA